jgi:excisionase family DNA binding protein
MEKDIGILAYGYEDAAKRLGVSRQTVIRLVKDGTLPSRQLGRRVLIPREALEKLVS